MSEKIYEWECTRVGEMDKRLGERVYETVRAWVGVSEYESVDKGL